MTLKPRSKNLESQAPEKLVNAAITIRVRDSRKGGKGLIPAEKFALKTDLRTIMITRRHDESEKTFIERANQLSAAHVLQPRSNNDLPSAPILMQVV